MARLRTETQTLNMNASNDADSPSSMDGVSLPGADPAHGTLNFTLFGMYNGGSSIVFMSRTYRTRWTRAGTTQWDFDPSHPELSLVDSDYPPEAAVFDQYTVVWSLVADVLHVDIVGPPEAGHVEWNLRSDAICQTID